MFHLIWCFRDVMQAERLDRSKNQQKYLLLKVIQIKIEAPGHHFIANPAICVKRGAEAFSYVT